MKFYLTENVNDAGNMDENMTGLELFHQTKMYKGGNQKDVAKRRPTQWKGKKKCI